MTLPPPRRQSPSPDAFRPLELVRRQQPDATRSGALEALLRAQERLANQGTMGVPSGLQDEPVWAQAARFGAEVLPPFSVPEVVEGAKKVARGDYAGGGKQMGTEALFALATGGAGRKAAKLLKTELGAAGVLAMEADRMAGLSDRQFNKLRNSLPGLSQPVEDYAQHWDAKNRLFEEWQRRGQLRDQQRAADAMNPTVFREGPMPGADASRAFGPGQGRRRGGWQRDYMADSVVSAVPDAVEGIRAWHGSGSGQDLTGFSAKFIGTGQGNKYGYGHYSSQATDVAEKFAAPTASGKRGLYEVVLPVQPNALLNYDTMLRAQSPDILERVNHIVTTGVDVTKLPRKQLQEMLQQMDRNGIFTDAAARREGIRPPTLEELQQSARDMELQDYLTQPVMPYEYGATVLRRLETLLGNKGAAKALQQVGIPGVQYTDPMAQLRRTAGASAAAPQNYVMFNPATIKILQALGLAGMVGGVGAGASPRSSRSSSNEL